MLEGEIFDEYEYLNNQKKQNIYRVEKTYNETNEPGSSNSILKFADKFNEPNEKNHSCQSNELKLFSEVKKQENLMQDGIMNSEMHENHLRNSSTFKFQSDYQKIRKSEGRQLCEIEVHKSESIPKNLKDLATSINENTTSYNPVPVTRKERLIDRVPHSMNHSKVTLSLSSVPITKSLIQELEKSGVLINNSETTQFGKKNKCVTEKTHASFNSTKMELLDDALQEFNITNGQYLSFGRSNTNIDEKKTKFKAPPIFKEFTKPPLGILKVYKNPEIKTLGDSIAYFNLFSHVEQLETSLEDVRRNKKEKEHHEECFKQIDKEIQKLSFKYHPDKVKNRGGTEIEITTAQTLQTAINSTRTVLKLLNSAFMEDIGTDHKFGFYTALSIDSLCNEDEMKNRIYEVIFKIGVISRIKQQNIISEIRKFLIESKSCIHSYLNGLEEFEKHRDLALFHLKCCIKGFKKLCAGLDDVKEQCTSEKNSENMQFCIQKMAYESKRHLQLLKSLKKIAKASLRGNYQFFSPKGVMDPYFVLPFVSYVNVILMCNVMRRNSSIFDMLNNINPELDPYYRDDLGYMRHAYYLASFCSGNKYHESMVLKIMGKMEFIKQGYRVNLSKKEIKEEFGTVIYQISDFMEHKFKVHDYNGVMSTNLLMLDLKKCMSMMTEYEEKEQKLTKGIKEFQKKTEKMDEKYAKFDKMMEAAEELNQKVKNRLERSKEISEKVSNALSDHFQE